MITSPGFPNDYPPYSHISWLIQLPKGNFIEFNFLSFRTQGCWSDDSLTIYNGPSDASPVIGEFCEKTMPASFISPGHEILLVFRSSQSDYFDYEYDDSSETFKGFQLEYKTSSKAFLSFWGILFVWKSCKYHFSWPLYLACINYKSFIRSWLVLFQVHFHRLVIEKQ